MATARSSASPLGLGFPLLIAPVEGLGDEAVEVVLAAVAALGFVLAALLARRIVPEPYASAGAGLAGLSAPAVAYAGTILPAMTAGDAARGRDAVRGHGARDAAAGAGLRGGGDARRAAVARSAARDPGAAGRRRAVPLVPRAARRGTMGLIAVELAVASLVLYATLNERLYGGFTPWSQHPSAPSRGPAPRRSASTSSACRGC